MSSTGELFEQAMALHRAGRLLNAESLYRGVLAADPGHHDACCLLATLCHTQGRVPEAVGLLTRAIQSRPDDAEVHFDLGMILAGLDQLEEGMSHLQAACRLRPDSEEFSAGLRQVKSARHGAQANEFASQGDLLAAEQHCRLAAQLTPRAATSHTNLANILRARGRLEEATDGYRRALEIDAASIEARRELGHVYLQQGCWGAAAREFRQAVAASPNDVDALNGLATALAQLRSFQEAAQHFQRLTALQPENPAAHSNLGAMLGAQGFHAPAVAAFHRAIELDPFLADAHANLGDVLKDQNQCAAAIAAYRRAIDLQPDFVDAHLNLATALFLEGRLAEAWPEYEWRLRAPLVVQAQTHAHAARWQGETLPHATLLLHCEQGTGDSIQFVRYAPLVRQRVGCVAVEVAPAMSRLLADFPGIDRVVARGEPTGPFDAQVSLLSLPGILGTTLETIPAQRSYLAPPKDLAAAWREEFADRSRLKVGIAWQGNPHHPRDRERSIPLRAFASLAELDEVQLYSLQSGPGREQLAGMVRIVDLGDRLGDFSNTAAIVCNLDLVITCDSAPAHLAGALGVEAWVALAFAPDWRWLLERPDSPWYPTMRLFRQRTPGDWDGVFAEMAAALRARVRAIKAS